MRGRVWDAIIVLIAAFSGIIIDYASARYNANIPPEYKFVWPFVFGLVIFLFGLFVSEVLFSTKFVRLHLFRDKHARYIGYWIDSYSRTAKAASNIAAPPAATDSAIFYSVLQIYYSPFQNGYALSGITYTSSGARHASYNSVVVIFPYQTERKELRYQYIGTVFDRPQPLYGTGELYFVLDDEINGWFRDEEDELGHRELIRSKRLTSKFLKSLSLDKKYSLSQVIRHGDGARSFVSSLHNKRSTVFDVM
jgi:hypothetical protein